MQSAKAFLGRIGPAHVRARVRRAAPRRRAIAVATGAMLATLWAGAAGAQITAQDLAKLSLEDLGKVVVTSVAKSPQQLADAPASIYVITHDEIMRSGAQTVPEMLRLAPNLEVFQTSPSAYVISARGFVGAPGAENLSNKLLVLIDGRSVYNPVFSGVYWEMQDLVPADIARIEVISGPGAALWGANAVNGVINIVTRSSDATQGGLLTLGYGTQRTDVNWRYGGRLNSETTYRVYAKTFHDNAFDLADGTDARDGSSKPQVGFGVDWQRGPDQVRFAGNVFQGPQDQGPAPDQFISGSNVQAHWSRSDGNGSSFQVLGYFDRVHRMAVPHGGGFTINTTDVQGQQNFRLGDMHRMTWGVGARSYRYDIVNAISPATTFAFYPHQFTTHVLNAFVQDRMALGKKVTLTLGIKAENDPHAGTSWLPNLRVAWNAPDGTLLWAAASHAIRAPTLLDTSVVQKAGSQLFLTGNPDFLPEKLTAFEVGYRKQFGSSVLLNVTAFDDRYADLKTVEATPVTTFPLYFGNGMRGHVRGVEAWATWQATAWWRLSSGIYVQHRDLRFGPGASGVLGTWQAGDDPERHAFVRSAIDFSDHWSLNLDARGMDALPNPHVPGYVELNVHLDWHINRTFALSLVGTNVLHAWHLEYPGGDRIPRAAYLQARVTY